MIPLLTWGLGASSAEPLNPALNPFLVSPFVSFPVWGCCAPNADPPEPWLHHLASFFCSLLVSFHLPDQAPVKHFRITHRSIDISASVVPEPPRSCFGATTVRQYHGTCIYNTYKNRKVQNI